MARRRRRDTSILEHVSSEKVLGYALNVNIHCGMGVACLVPLPGLRMLSVDAVAGSNHGRGELRRLVHGYCCFGLNSNDDVCGLQ